MKLQQNVRYSQKPPRNYTSCISTHKNAINLLKLANPVKGTKLNVYFRALVCVLVHFRGDSQNSNSTKIISLNCIYFHTKMTKRFLKLTKYFFKNF